MNKNPARSTPAARKRARLAAATSSARTPSGSHVLRLREQAIRDVVQLTEAQVARLRTMLRLFCFGMGAAWLAISGTYLVFGKRLANTPASRVLLDAMPPYVWTLLISGTLLILAATFCPTWKRAAIIVAACLAFWQSAAYAMAPIVNPEASPLIAVLFFAIAGNLVLGAVFARIQQTAHDLDTGQIRAVKQRIEQEVARDTGLDTPSETSLDTPESSD
jgi:hypothetical protein